MILKSEHEGTKQVMHLIKETYSLQISRVESCKYGNISLEGLVSPCSNGTLHTVKIPVIIVAIFIKGVQKEKKQTVCCIKNKNKEETHTLSISMASDSTFLAFGRFFCTLKRCRANLME